MHILPPVSSQPHANRTWFLLFFFLSPSIISSIFFFHTQASLSGTHLTSSAYFYFRMMQATHNRETANPKLATDDRLPIAKLVCSEYVTLLWMHRSYRVKKLVIDWREKWTKSDENRWEKLSMSSLLYNTMAPVKYSWSPVDRSLQRHQQPVQIEKRIYRVKVPWPERKFNETEPN